MAQRVATEYVNTCLVLSSEELSELVTLFRSAGLACSLKVLNDSGDCDLELSSASETSAPVLKLEKNNGKYVMTGSYRFTDWNAANAMRQGVARFRGSAVVRRIYEQFILEYHYCSGSVLRIIEHSREGERLVFERKDQIIMLMELFRKTNAERQIQDARHCIDRLLDERNASAEAEKIRRIDDQLRKLAHRLFVLEA